MIDQTVGAAPDIRATASSTWMRICSAFVLATAHRHGSATAAAIDQAAMRRHQEKHFRTGMAKLGLIDCGNDVRRVASYHYLSNALGGLPLEYVEEHPRKIWLRYRAPYWVGDGMTSPSSGPAGLGAEVGHAPFRGWHANNGAVLGNPHLVFVQTQNLVDGDPWDAGYYTEAERTFPDGEAYLLRPGEWGPPFDPDLAPKLDENAWPLERRLGALRNYALSTTMSRITIAASILGLDAAAGLAQAALQTVLTQFAEPLRTQLGIRELRTPQDAARYFTAFSRLAGDVHHAADPEVHVGVANSVTLAMPRPSYWRYEEQPQLEIDLAFARAWDATLALSSAALGCHLEVDGETQCWTFLPRRVEAAGS